MSDASKILEESIEGRLFRKVNDDGGFCIKLNPLWLIGIPDRLVILHERIAFCETKRPKGGKLRKIQQKRLLQLLQLAAECWVLWSHDDVDEFMKGGNRTGNASQYITAIKRDSHKRKELKDGEKTEHSERSATARRTAGRIAQKFRG